MAKIVVAGVTLLVLAWAAARLWVGSDKGRRVVEKKVDQAVATHGGGHIELGNISGSLVGGATIDGLIWRDDAGAPALRARRVVAHWSAARALAGRPELELRLEGLDVDLDRLATLDLGEAARSLGEHGGDEVTLGRLEIVDGTVHAGGRRLEKLALVGRATVGREERLGDRGELVLEKLDAVLGAVPIAAAGAASWDRRAGRFAVDGLAVHVGRSGGKLDGSIGPDAADVRLTDLHITPEDLRRLAPGSDAPRRTIVGEARAHGPLAALVLEGALRPDRGRVVLSGRVDVPARRGEITLTLEGAGMDFAPALVTGQLTLRGRDAEKGFRIDWRGTGRYDRRELDPNLPADRRQANATLRPGGRFQGQGIIDLDPVGPSATLDFHLVLDDPGQAARLIAGPDLAAAPKPLTVDGTWRLSPGTPARLAVRRP